MRNQRNNTVYIKHISDAIHKLEQYSNEHSREEFSQNDWDQDAVVRNLEIIGEAANNLDESFLKSHEAVPWRKIIDLRNIVAHDYADIDLSIIWNILNDYIPELKTQILAILEEQV